MSSSAVVPYGQDQNAGGGGAVSLAFRGIPETEKETFQKLVMSFGDPTKIVVSEKESFAGGGEMEIAISRPGDKKGLRMNSPVMKMTFVKDTGEGKLGGKGKFDSIKRPGAKFVFTLGVGTIRPENKKNDPLIELRQRAWLANGFLTVHNAIGSVFDSDAKMFTDIKTGLIATSKKVQREILFSFFKGQNPTKPAAEISRMVEQEITSNPEVGEQIRLRAREEFVSKAKNPFGRMKEGEAEVELNMPLYVDMKVYTVRRDRVKTWDRGKRPEGPTSVQLPPKPENWPDIFLTFGEEYTWSPISYVKAAGNKNYVRPMQTYTVTKRKARKIQAMMTVQRLVVKEADDLTPTEKKDLATAKTELAAVDVLPDDDDITTVRMPDPEWSPITGMLWHSLGAMSMYVGMYKKVDDGTYGATLSPIRSVTVYDKISAPKNQTQVGGDQNAAASLARDFDDDDNNDATAAADDECDDGNVDADGKVVGEGEDEAKFNEALSKMYTPPVGGDKHDRDDHDNDEGPVRARAK